ncbi:thioesterase domain-containing protein/acyl carrier protein [Cytobacillus purgationiresistens]|uniref:Thioesterase domain-containing protein/acyl carrier protein n=1 Tax=Cytobacillus purgationiresistens TaxID=863449 RepID=A0ABU0AR91_9BACI|nr:thioesterase domain-containing protein/acyl carrier protein [Cytobacillus purgationiresistens]
MVIAQKEDVKDPMRLREVLRKERITFWDSVPTTLHHLIRSFEESGTPYLQEDLRLIFLSGDWIPVDLKKRAEAYLPQAQIIGLGGATEGTVWSNYYPIHSVEEGQKSIPYGKPIGNNRFYILDANQRPVPQGVRGELYIGGIGVARGYMGDEEKTNSAFMKIPYHEGRVYRTGDMGRMLPDGNMEFLGRKDHQVKVRGYRIELGEVETQLSSHPAIKEALVTVLKDEEGNNGLTAYIVGERVKDHELREFLSTALPMYMLPTYYVWLDRLPLSENGKIDRKSLPDPRRGVEKAYEAPESETAQALAVIWKNLLGVERVGLHDDFFELGGHSLKATILIGKILKRWNIEFPLEWVFRYPSLLELTNKIDNFRNYISGSDNPVTQLSDGQIPIFCFPPVSGFGFEFKSLADNLLDHKIIAFDFIEQEDRLQRYIELIKEFQPEGPYTLLGYSAGGNLAFEVAKNMEISGESLSSLIILDAECKTSIKEISDRQLEKEIEDQIQNAEFKYKDLLTTPSLRQKVKKRIEKYRRYLEETVNEGTINSDIIVISTEDNDGLSWSSSTIGKHQVIKGFGNHMGMIHSPYVSKHAEILRNLSIMI